ncbi:MAG: NADPH-dependent F420 reductase [Burkholderiales bacterium]|nr:NADPH-dependent F420 reductase [Burkholderiales bacterium]
MSENLPRIAVLGGTGKEGRALAARWLAAGYRIVIGSRDAARAAAAATELDAHGGRGLVSGADLATAAQAGDIVVLAVPFAAQLATLEQVKSALDGKILIDVTVPLMPPKVSRVQLPAGGSAVVRAQALLGAAVKVVSAFQNVSFEALQHIGEPVDCDVLVCGDDAGARETVVGLARAAGMRAWHAGPLVNSAAAEALTSVLIFMNLRYKVPHAGIRITGADGRVGPRQ